MRKGNLDRWEVLGHAVCVVSVGRGSVLMFWEGSPRLKLQDLARVLEGSHAVGNAGGKATCGVMVSGEAVIPATVIKLT